LRSVRDESLKVEVLRAGRQMDWGGVRTDVIAPPPGAPISEINDNLVAILLTYGMAPRTLGRRRRGEGGLQGEQLLREALNGHQGLKVQTSLNYGFAAG
jgi:hypothetical protein